ncbi:MAG: TIGR02266 family protein [Deltaproteobacteria bacterium]|nr:TIGR02266 family protein [Deltaproteobacteria bacterium]
MVEDEASGEDRRIHERFETRIAVDVHSDRPSGDHFLFAYIENISEMGIFVRTDDPLPPGTEVTLRFTASKSRIELDGCVMWINPVRDDGDNPNPGMGVRFESLSPEDREHVVELIRAVAYLND